MERSRLSTDHTTSDLSHPLSTYLHTHTDMRYGEAEGEGEGNWVNWLCQLLGLAVWWLGAQGCFYWHASRRPIERKRADTIDIGLLIREW